MKQGLLTKLPWVQVVFYAWLLVVCVLALRLAFGIYQLRGLIHESIPAPLQLREQLEVLGTRMDVRRPVRLYVSQRVRVPVSFGWRRPCIVLPVGLAQ